MDVDDIRLPDGIHATLLTDRDIVTGEMLAYPVVWADRPYSDCPLCGQDIGVEEACPVALNTGAGQGGQIEEWDKTHGCGYWLSVSWREVTAPAGRDTTDDDQEDQEDEEVAPGIGEDDVLTVARELAADREQQIAAEQKKIRGKLRKELAASIARLGEPLGDGESLEDRADEVTTGSETEPGVYCDGGQWLAWAYEPVDSDPITVDASDLTTAADA